MATLAWFAVALLLPLISLPPSEPLISTRQARQPRSYAALLDEYVHGDADAAVAELAEWDASRLLAQATPPGTSRVQRDRYLQAAAMIHLEAILKGAPLDGHVPMARAAILEVMNRTDLRPFWRSWLVVMVSVLLSKGTTLRGVPLPPDDPELLLLDGSIAEGLGTYVRAATTSLAGPGGHAVSMYAGLEPARLLQDAERKYRSALKMDPQIVEARLRLGRVLHLRDRPDKARPELEQARREAREPYLQYLASLFLGQHDEAWATVRRVFGDEAIAQSPEDDPWWDYAYAQCWQAGRRTAELRAMVRR